LRPTEEGSPTVKRVVLPSRLAPVYEPSLLKTVIKVVKTVQKHKKPLFADGSILPARSPGISSFCIKLPETGEV